MRYIKLDEKWLKKLRETAHFYSADIVCGAGTDWILKTAEAENKTLFEVVSYLENAPSEDVAEVRHGRWLHINNPNSDIYEHRPISVCNICGYEKIGDSNYCPECGAKMDGGEE